MKLRTIVYLLISSLLCSCVAVVVAGAAAGLVVYDRRSITTLESDTRIFHVIHNQLVSNPAFADSRVIVSSFNQVVLLVGQVPNMGLRSMAEKIARNTPNVRRVYNEITVAFPIPLSQRTKDTWITSQVRSLMLTKKGLESGSIRIVTENAVVYLMGIATHEQADLAVSVARQVDGVQKVVKVFQYIV
ncbi:BON domain-containing protein [Legionella jordanis]|uniref:Periplasmic protein n=1 Tax=Legionella jordanis TaxID=456 RepID=A0A0W0VCQ9_9GAMM|nr:BON domain-containing protein [Legionella jordanis]KTD17891.1 Periplasmic protein [Legionella jordanis]RMX02410.1 BON domain-containing protein [Legionella jordanis]RMX21747.1 BON domain-containing protein [Legionella jordanis]VEH14018.1 lipoproteins [Legionella jordanis]HAT8713861.1 BON domain-containing protein [Legionella jordanis]